MDLWAGSSHSAGALSADELCACPESRASATTKTHSNPCLTCKKCFTTVDTFCSWFVCMNIQLLLVFNQGFLNFCEYFSPEDKWGIVEKYSMYLKKNYSKRHSVTNPPQNTPLCFDQTYPTVLAISWSSCVSPLSSGCLSRILWPPWCPDLNQNIHLL